MGVDRDLHTVWLDQPGFFAMPRHDRAGLVRSQVEHGRGNVPTVRGFADLAGARVRRQGDGHRFVWWPDLVEGDACQIATRHVAAQEYGTSRHMEVPEEVWAGCAAALPFAGQMAGSFAAEASGPNCFGTVMAAAGVPGADREWMQRDPWEAWLTDRCSAGGDDERPGTILLWRSPDGLAQHAALTLRGGWALHKASQSWESPRTVREVTELIREARTPGRRISRLHLRAAA